MADALVLGTSSNGVRVQVPSLALKSLDFSRFSWKVRGFFVFALYKRRAGCAY